MLTKRWPKLLVLVIGIVLLYTGFTDADFVVKHFIYDNFFRATTLEFSHRQTANEFPTSTLFNVSSMITGGFAVESVRVKKEGEMDFLYQITPEITNANHLCELLKLRIFNSNWQEIYHGELISLSLKAEVTDEHDDLIFVIYLENSIGKNQRCDFNFIVETMNRHHETKVGFWDKEVLQNFIST